MNDMNKNIFSPFSEFTGTQEEFDALMENEMVEVRKYLDNKKKDQGTIEEQLSEIRKKFKRSQNLYEAFDPAKFETKVRIDLLFFEHLCQNLPEVEKMPELISGYYRTVQQIQEMVNIKAESHRMLGTSVLNESYDAQQKIFSKILSEHINNNYYRLSKEKRSEKFLNESQEYASILVEKGLDPNQSIQIAIKAALLESLIASIAMPKFVQRRVKFLCEDKDYGKVFDQEKLKSLWESFKQQTKNVSRILAAAV